MIWRKPGLQLLRLGNAKRFGGFQISFAAKPILHCTAQLFERNARACFEQAVANGKSVVEEGVIGKVPHSEIVDPVDGAGVRMSGFIHPLDLQFADKHILQCRKICFASSRRTAKLIRRAQAARGGFPYFLLRASQHQDESILPRPSWCRFRGHCRSRSLLTA